VRGSASPARAHLRQAPIQRGILLHDMFCRSLKGGFSAIQEVPEGRGRQRFDGHVQTLSQGGELILLSLGDFERKAHHSNVGRSMLPAHPSSEQHNAGFCSGRSHQTRSQRATKSPACSKLRLARSYRSATNSSGLSARAIRSVYLNPLARRSPWHRARRVRRATASRPTGAPQDHPETRLATMCELIGHVTRFDSLTTHAPFGIAFHPAAGPRATLYGYAVFSSAAVHCVLRALLAVRTAATCAAVAALALLPHCERMYVTTFATS